MLGAVAQFERDLIIERTKKAALAMARKNGKRLGTSGQMAARHGQAGPASHGWRRTHGPGSGEHLEGIAADAVFRSQSRARA